MTSISQSDDILVSAVSIYEIDFKRRDPARARAQDLALRRAPENLIEALPSLGLTLIPISPADAFRAASLPIEHGDPWDRILLAQAMSHSVRLLSADRPLQMASEAHPDTRGVIIF